jgi:hypothetical protein
LPEDSEISTDTARIQAVRDRCEKGKAVALRPGVTLIVDTGCTVPRILTEVPKEGCPVSRRMEAGEREGHDRRGIE